MTRDAYGKTAAVASAHPLASQSGLAVLKAGGNAVDAAAAVTLTLGVVQPAFSGLGGGGFMLIHLAKTGENVIIDYRETAPKRATSDMYRLRKDGEVADDENSVGFKAVGVPGALAGLSLALERYGTITLKDAAQDAIRYAINGYEVSELLALIMRLNMDAGYDKFKSNPAAGKLMLKPDGSIYRAGEMLVMADLGRSIERIANNGIGEFYEGPVADSLVENMAENGGLLGKDDLRAYEAKFREPLVADYKGMRIITMPPPSSGGVALIQLLRVLEEVDLRGKGPNTAETIDLMAKALGSVWPARARVADPDYVDVRVDELLDESFIAGLKEQAFNGARSGKVDFRDSSQTTHFSVIDGEGNVVAATESLECYFGSGVVVPGTGVFLNDTMHDFDPAPGGLNSVQPGERPMSSMMPTIFMKGGSPVLVLGSSAGPRIITAVFQVALNVLEHGMNVQDAIAAPRFHFQGGEGNQMVVESRLPEGVRTDLVRLGYNLEVRGEYDFFFGGVHAIAARDGTLHGGADPRRDGAAQAY